MWGGQDARRTATDDGAAYDVATTTWRRIESPPPGLSGGRAIAWGPEMAIVSASSAGAYDPIRDGWRLLPSPAIAPDEEILDILTVSDGLGIVTIQRAQGRDPLVGQLLLRTLTATDENWQTLRPLTLDEFVPNQVIATSDGVIVWDGDGSRGERYSPARGWTAVQALSPPPGQTINSSRIGYANATVFAVAQLQTPLADDLVVATLAEGEWTNGPLLGPPSVWSERFYEWKSSSISVGGPRDGRGEPLAMVDTVSRTVRRVDGFPLETAYDMTVAVGDDAVLFWGGTDGGGVANASGAGVVWSPTD